MALATRVVRGARSLGVELDDEALFDRHRKRDLAELLLLEQADLVLGEPLAAPSVLSGRVRSLDSRAVRPPAEGLPDAAARAVARSGLVHAVSPAYQRARSWLEDRLSY